MSDDRHPRSTSLNAKLGNLNLLLAIVLVLVLVLRVTTLGWTGLDWTDLLILAVAVSILLTWVRENVATRADSQLAAELLARDVHPDSYDDEGALDETIDAHVAVEVRQRLRDTATTALVVVGMTVVLVVVQIFVQGPASLLSLSTLALAIIDVAVLWFAARQLRANRG